MLICFARIHSFNLIHSACPARLHSRRTGAISVCREVIYTAGKRSSHRSLTGGNVYGSKCILQLRGVRPFLSEKYDLTQHSNYQYTADCDPRNTFNIEAFLSHKLTLKPEDVYEVVDVDESA